MHRSSSSTVIHVIEHAPPPNMRMVGGALTFANPIFDKRNAKRIGRDQGFCLDITLVKSSECVWTTFLLGGQISTEKWLDRDPERLDRRTLALELKPTLFCRRVFVGHCRIRLRVDKELPGCRKRGESRRRVRDIP